MQFCSRSSSAEDLIIFLFHIEDSLACRSLGHYKRLNRNFARVIARKSHVSSAQYRRLRGPMRYQQSRQSSVTSISSFDRSNSRDIAIPRCGGSKENHKVRIRGSQSARATASACCMHESRWNPEENPSRGWNPPREKLATYRQAGRNVAGGINR